MLLEHLNRYRDDESVCRFAIQQNGLALQYVSETLRNKLSIEAIKQNKSAVFYTNWIDFPYFLYTALPVSFEIPDAINYMNNSVIVTEINDAFVIINKSFIEAYLHIPL